MSASSIGIQCIMPNTGTSPQTPPQQPQQPANDDTPIEAKQAPPPPGMGKYVDKTA